jgi:hypothetical protein
LTSGAMAFFEFLLILWRLWQRTGQGFGISDQTSGRWLSR